MTASSLRELSEAQLDEPKYLLGQAARAAGISTNLLKAWITRSPPVVVLSQRDRTGQGKGSSRLFTLRRVLAVSLTAELTFLGVMASRAGKIAHIVMDTQLVQSNRREITKKPLPNVWLQNDLFIVAYSRSEGCAFVSGNDPLISLLPNPAAPKSDVAPCSFVAVSFGDLVRVVFDRLGQNEGGA